MKYRLKEAREFAQMSQLEVSLELGTTQMQISKYENEHQEPTLARAIELANLYQVSLDWIAGRSDKKEIT